MVGREQPRLPAVIGIEVIDLLRFRGFYGGCSIVFSRRVSAAVR